MNNVDNILESIGETEKNLLRKQLLDLTLKSKNAQNLTPELSKEFLSNYRLNNLESIESFKTLLKVSIYLDKEKTVEKFQELNLIEAVNEIRKN